MNKLPKEIPEIKPLTPTKPVVPAPPEITPGPEKIEPMPSLPETEPVQFPEIEPTRE